MGIRADEECRFLRADSPNGLREQECMSAAHGAGAPRAEQVRGRGECVSGDESGGGCKGLLTPLLLLLLLLGVFETRADSRAE